MRVYVLEEYYGEHQEQEVLGVFSSPEKALQKMKKYYGEYKELGSIDVTDFDDTEFKKAIRVLLPPYDSTRLVLELRIFEIDEQ